VRQRPVRLVKRASTCERLVRLVKRASRLTSRQRASRQRASRQRASRLRLVIRDSFVPSFFQIF
jgi:hypothetical protein